MRPLLVLALLLLAACTEASASRVDENTFRIEGPPCASCGNGPNERMANKVCPKGYYVLGSETHKGGVDRAIDEDNPMTIWTIHCI
jgi:hypothetical protein